MCDEWESVGDIAARIVKGVGFADFGRVYEARAQRPPTASPRVMTLLADMSPGGSIAGPRGEAAAADGTERVAGRSPPFGASGRALRSRNVKGGEVDSLRSCTSPEADASPASYNEVFAAAGRSGMANPWRDVGAPIVIPFPEKGRAPKGAPGQVRRGHVVDNHPGQDRRSGRETNTGRPPAGFRAHARN